MKSRAALAALCALASCAPSGTHWSGKVWTPDRPFALFPVDPDQVQIIQPAPQRQRMTAAPLADWQEEGLRRAYCLPYKTQAATILSIKRRGAPFDEAVDYAAQQSYEAARSLDPLSAQDNETALLHLVGAVYYGETDYDAQPGGFAEYAYRICMQGHIF